MSSTKRARASGCIRSTVKCWLQFGSRRHSGGTPSREQVKIRQPASLKRFTVA
jgi:hypothetical protein